MAKKHTDDISYLKNGLPSSESDILYPTGFFAFDMQNGYRTLNKNTGNYEYNMGIVDGSMIAIIGRSNAGKSTFAMQLAGNLIRGFDKSNIIHIDIEQGCSNDERNRMLLQMDRETYLKKYIRYNANITIEALENLIKEEMDRKFNNAAELRYDTGKVDIKGNPIIKFQPTVIVLDSIPHLCTDKVMDGDRTNMDSANIANGLTSFLKKYTQKIRAYNIIFICINHIRNEINATFYPKKSDMPGLKQGETMPGGTAFKYGISYLIRLDDLSPKFTDDDEYGIAGHYTKLLAAKTRQGPFNNESKLFFSGKYGFIDYLSNFTMLKESDRITQSGAYFSMSGYEKKFTKKQVSELYNNDIEFRNIINNLTAQCVIDNINSIEDEANKNGLDVVNDVLSFLV